MTDRDFINFLIKTCFSNARDPHLATLYNTVMNRLNDIAGKLEKQEKVLNILKEKNVDILELKILIKHHNDRMALKLYNRQYKKEWQLTNEEFDTLKEWMK